MPRPPLAAAARTALLPRPGERLLPALTAVLLVLSYPPLHLLVPPFVALAPFAVWVARLPAGPGGEASATRGGLLLGVVMHGVLLHWIVPALAWVTPLAPLAFALTIGVLSSLTALFGWTLHRAVHGAGAPLWLALPVAWTGVEWLQGNLPGTLAFPWLGLGTSLTGYPEIVGIAELFGARGATFWLASVSGLTATLVVHRKDAGRGFGRKGRRIAALAVLICAPAAWGMWRAGTLVLTPGARVAVVGTDIPAEARLDPIVWNTRAGRLLDGVLPVIRGEAVDLVVLPEGMLMGRLSRAEASAEAQALGGALQRAAQSTGASFLLGAYLPGAEGDELNSVLVVHPDGPDPVRYDKRRLVPLVEWRPGMGRTQAVGGPAGHDPASDEPYRVAGAAFSPLICFEAAFAGAARAARLAGADILVNVTNDAWFGASRGVGRAGRDQHAAHLVMRAIETRVGAVRSANGGHSYFVDPVGRVDHRLPPQGGGAAVGIAQSSAVRTLYLRTGDLAGPGSLLLALLLAIAGGLGRTPASLDPRQAPM